MNSINQSFTDQKKSGLSPIFNQVKTDNRNQPQVDKLDEKPTQLIKNEGVSIIPKEQRAVSQKYRETHTPDIEIKTDPPKLSDKHRSGRSYRSIITDIAVNTALFEQIRGLLIDILKNGTRNNFNNEEEIILDRYKFLFEHPEVWLQHLIDEKKSAIELKKLLGECPI